MFFEIDEVFAKFLGWVLLKWVLKRHALHHTCIITIFSCIIDVCYIYWFVVCFSVWIGLSPWHFFGLHATCSCIFLHTYLHFFIFLYIDVFGDFLHVSLSPSLFLSVSCIMAPKRKSTSSQNPLYPGHLLLLTLHLLMYGFVMIKPGRTFGELFLMRHSFGTPSHLIGFFRYWPTHCHSQ